MKLPRAVVVPRLERLAGWKGLVLPASGVIWKSVRVLLTVAPLALV